MTQSTPFKSRLEIEGICVAIGNAKGDDEELLPAYNLTQANRRAECTIQAEPDSRFCIHLGYSGNPAARRGLGLQAYVHLDGLLVEKAFMEINPLKKQNEIELTGAQDTDEDGRDIEYPFYFTKRETTEEENEPDIAEKPTDMLGTLNIELFWARRTEKKHKGLEHALSYNLYLVTLPTPEEKTKAQHEIAAGLGEPEPYEGVVLDMEIEKNDHKEYSFVFRYAPKGWILSRFGGQHSGELKVEATQTATPNPTPPPPCPRRQPLSTFPQKRRVEIDVDGFDYDEKAHGSTKIKKARTEEPQSLEGTVSSVESIDQWRLGC